MSNETPTETDAAQSENTHAEGESVDRYNYHPTELDAPPRNKEDHIMALTFVELSLRALGAAFIAGAVIGLIAGQWMIASISISTAGLPQPLLLGMLAVMGGTGMVGAELLAALTTAYAKWHYGLTVDYPL